jgi:hypothetical protein
MGPRRGFPQGESTKKVPKSGLTAGPQGGSNKGASACEVPQWRSPKRGPTMGPPSGDPKGMSRNGLPRGWAASGVPKVVCQGVPNDEPQV